MNLLEEIAYKIGGTAVFHSTKDTLMTHHVKKIAIGHPPPDFAYGKIGDGDLICIINKNILLYIKIFYYI